MNSLIMPQVSEITREGTIVRWLKKEGDVVRQGEILAKIETDVVSVELQSGSSGVLHKIVHFNGETVPALTVIAFVGAKDEHVPDFSPEFVPSPEAPSQAADHKTCSFGRLKGTAWLLMLLSALFWGIDSLIQQHEIFSRLLCLFSRSALPSCVSPIGSIGFR